MAIPGTRGAIGKKTVNASTHFNALFDIEEPTVVEEELDETKLENLEDEQL
jgi:sulfur relay (sulfurtransferase) DsrF/TusC family protein